VRDGYFKDLEAIVTRPEIGGRPHWAKTFYLSPQQLRVLYPRFDDWQRVRSQLDPHSVFANDFLNRHLGPVQKPPPPAAAPAAPAAKEEAAPAAAPKVKKAAAP
jgi:hypothetical protein